MNDWNSKAMETILEAAGALGMQLPAESEAAATMRLVGLKLDNASPDKISVPAAKARQQGTAIIGPKISELTSIHSRMDLVRASTGVRWVLNPAARKHGNAVGFTRPSITPTHKVELACPTCGYTTTVWWDRLFRIYDLQAKIRHAHMPNTQVVRPTILCDACMHMTVPKYVQMTTRHRATRIIPEAVGKYDPVCTGLDDALIDQLEYQIWSKRRPAEPDDTFLPRIWAVYIRGLTPTDLPPHDPKGILIDQRLSARPIIGKSGEPFTYTIRPARVAFTHNGAASVRSFIMEANPEWSWGWVSADDITGATQIDYTRRFVTELATRKPARDISV